MLSSTVLSALAITIKVNGHHFWASRLAGLVTGSQYLQGINQNKYQVVLKLLRSNSSYIWLSMFFLADNHQPFVDLMQCVIVPLQQQLRPIPSVVWGSWTFYATKCFHSQDVEALYGFHFEGTGQSVLWQIAPEDKAPHEQVAPSATGVWMCCKALWVVTKVKKGPYKRSPVTIFIQFL